MFAKLTLLAFINESGSESNYFHLRIYQPAAGFPKDKEITILSAASPGGSAMNIDYTPFNTRVATVREHDKFVSYPIDPITINSGDFIVGYSFKRTANEGEFPVALDESSPQSRSFESTNGTAFTKVNNANFMIRGATSTSACSNGACSYKVWFSLGVVSGAGAPGTLSIDTQPSCQWKASRTATWITLTAPVNQYNEVTGTGSGTVPFSVASNPTGTFRTGGISVLGRVMSLPPLTSLGEDPSEPEIYEIQAVPLIAQVPLAPPTAASVTIGGRVSTAAGVGLSGAIVSLVDQNGQTRTARTNAFGYYRFDEIVVGNTIILSAASKRYNFTPRAVSINDSIYDLDFVPLE